MRTCLTVSLVLLALLVSAPAWAGDGLGPPTRLTAKEGPIDAGVGHAAPFVFDWDRDGRPDLLVGQLGGGTLRIYNNVGTVTAPRFEDFEVFKVGESEATVPTG